MHARNILVGYDESLPAKRALALAEEMALQSGARLLLLTVLPIPPAMGMEIAFSPPIPTELEIVDTRRALEREAERIRAQGRHVDVLVELGDPGRSLLDVAQRFESDLIVLGRSGKGAIARAVMGSVTTTMLHATRKPILVVP